MRPLPSQCDSCPCGPLAAAVPAAWTLGEEGRRPLLFLALYTACAGARARARAVLLVLLPRGRRRRRVPLLAALDFVDGIAARALGQASSFGAALDVVVDLCARAGGSGSGDGGGGVRGWMGAVVVTA